MNAEIDKSGFQQLAAVYGLLSRLWLREMDSATLEALADPALRQVWESLGGHIPHQADGPVIEALAADFCQLLVGPTGHRSPVQSIWEEGQFQGSAASSMQRFFELLPDYCPPSNINDHIANQFDYLGELFARAASNKHPESFTMIADQFFARHMKWTGDFLDAVAASAQTEFYRGLARLTQDFLEQ